MDLAIELADRRALLREAATALQARQFARTQSACAPLLAADPHDIEALLLHGLALAAARQPDPAAPILNRVAAARIGHAHPCRDLDGLLGAQDYAIQLRTCLDLAPQDVRLRLLWADCRHAQGDLDGAADTLAALLLEAPGFAAAHHRLGLVQAELGNINAAIEQILRAVMLDPVPALGWTNLGMLLKIQGRFVEALDAYAEALRRAPDDARIRVNRVVALLQAGRFADAWQDHEWRFALADHTGLPRARLLPPLASVPDLAGRTVLVTHEAGFGDTLQFCRYVPLLAARGARIALVVPAELQRLLATLSGVATMVPPGAPLPAHDWHCPMMSLPRAFGTVIETIPAPIPYLVPDPALVASWGARLPSGPAPRVGLVWAGQARPWLPGFATVDTRRSTSLATFAPLGAVDGVRFVSLQAGVAGGEARTPPPKLSIHDPMQEVRDFADTAAIIAHLDLVIGVDTSVIHLAGALGKPVFLLDRYDNCWRWLSGRPDSPWYPTLRIFRQTRIGDWTPVISAAAAALEDIPMTFPSSG